MDYTGAVKAMLEAETGKKVNLIEQHSQRDRLDLFLNLMYILLQ